MPPMIITKTSSPASLWKPLNCYPSGTVLAAQNSGKLFIKLYPRSDRGVIAPILVRIDDGSFYPCMDAGYQEMLFREVKAELKLEL